MSLDQSDKLASTPGPATAVSEAARPRRRLRPKIWPFDTGASEDTFATPSQPASGEVDHRSLAGPEPAVFGGVNPDSEADQQAAADQEAAENASEPLGTALDEAVRGNELLADAPKVNVGRIIRSTPFLLGSMLACLVGAYFFVGVAVPTETYVQTSVAFKNYDKLNELEVQDLQLELSKLLRTYPLRQQAWELLQKKSPGVVPGFLNSGLTFHRLDAISWDPEGVIHLRVDSDDPKTDITRLSAVTDVFYSELAARTRTLDQYKLDLAAQQKLLAQTTQQDADLKGKIDALLPDAQRYMDLKLIMQAMERFLDLADESNPLRLVARQNLARVAVQVAEARELSLQRDELLGQRVALQKQQDAIAAEIARLTRAVDVWVYPAPQTSNSLRIFDTRDHQKMIMRSTWVGVILFFAGLIAAFHIIDARAAERHRRERRELLKLQARASGSDSSDDAAPSHE